VKAVSIGIGGLVIVAAMFLAAWVFHRKHRTLQPHVDNTASGTAEHAVAPLDRYLDAIEAVPVSFSNESYLPASSTSPVSSSMDRTIKVAAILEPTSGSDSVAEAGVKVRKNEVPDYKDQVRSAEYTIPQSRVVALGIAADMGDADAIPQRRAMTQDPVTNDLTPPQDWFRTTAPLTPPQEQQQQQQQQQQQTRRRQDPPPS
jgi:hypothetical protein